MLLLSLHYISLRWRSQHLKRMENLYLERGFDQIEYQILGLISMIWSINGGKKPVYQRPFEQTTGLSLNLVPRLSRFLPFSEAVSEFKESTGPKLLLC